MAIAIKGYDGNPLTSLSVCNLGNGFIKIFGQLTFTGTYTNQANGGDTIDWTTIGDQIQGTLLSAFAYSVKPLLAAQYVFKKGTTLATWSLMIGTTPGTEISNAGAYPTSDVVHFEALIKKFM